MESDKLGIEEKLIAFKSAVTIIGAPVATALTGNPLVGVGITNLVLETFFGIQGDLRLKRAHEFISKLDKGIKSIDGSFDIDKVDKIDFGDLLESAIVKSTRARTNDKLERFKAILLNQLLDPVEYDYASKYLELVERLNEKQFQVLSRFALWDYEIEGYVKARKKLEQITGTTWEDKYLDNISSPNFKEEVEEMNQLSHKIKDGYEEKKLALTIFEPDESQFLQSELRSWGLIYNPSEGRASDTGQFHYFRCTPFAAKFINAVKSKL